MKFTISLAALAAFAATVSAQGISVINPTLGAKWAAGSTQTVTWTVSGAKTVTGLILRKGDPSNLETLYTISSEQLDASVAKFEWAIQADTQPGNDYAVQVTTDQGQQYSPFFEITAATGGSSNSSSSAGPSPSPSGSASVSSAAPSSSSAASSAAKSSAPASSSVASSAKPSSASASSSHAASSPAATENPDSAATSMKVNAVLGVAAGAAALALF